MRDSLFQKMTGLLLLALFLISAQAILAEQHDDKAVFVDLDGDGFNDNIADNDTDGLFDDYLTGQNDKMSEIGEANEGFISFDFNSQSDLANGFTKAEKFGLLKFSARGLIQCRGESGAQLNSSPGNGIGFGVVNSGACAGGICQD